MIVKTKITNPTDVKQRYSWIPKHGAFIAAKSSIVIEGDVYTLAEKIVKSRKCIDYDVQEGRVRLTLITDIDVIHPDQEKKLKKVKPVEAKLAEVKPVEAKSPTPTPDKVKPVKAKKPKKKKVKKTLEEENKEFNILGQGLQEGAIVDNKAPALDPFTNKEVKDDIPEAEDVSDFLWGNEQVKETLDEAPTFVSDASIAEVPAVDVPKIYTKLQLKKMLKAEVVELAADMGLDEADDMKKSDLIDWIFNNQ